MCICVYLQTWFSSRESSGGEGGLVNGLRIDVAAESTNMVLYPYKDCFKLLSVI